MFITGDSTVAENTQLDPTAMRTTLLVLLLAPLALTACDLEGNPAPGGPFGPNDFGTEAAERNDLDSVEVMCASYCTAAVGCDLAADPDDCAADCVEPMLAAEEADQGVAEDASTEPPPCESEADEAFACADEAVCDDFEACDDAIDAYVGCMSAG